MKRLVSAPRRAASFDSTMTPMIDVIFQLQIFFLCTSGFELPEGLLAIPKRLEVPRAAVVAPAGDLEIVRLTLRGTPAALVLELNHRPLAGMAEVRHVLGKLAGAAATLPVVLDIAPEVHLASVVEVYDACLAAGFSRIHFAAQGVVRP